MGLLPSIIILYLINTVDLIQLDYSQWKLPLLIIFILPFTFSIMYLCMQILRKIIISIFFFIINVCKCRIFPRINSDTFCLLCRHVCRGLSDNNWRGDHVSQGPLDLGFNNSRVQDICFPRKLQFSSNLDTCIEVLRASTV